MRRTAIPRSRDGCRTCRLRKVKCDETRPICGCCTKSKKDCVWGQIWKFSDSSPTVRRNYKIVPRADRRTWDASTRLNSPARQMTDVDATPLENTTGEEASQTLRRSSAEDTPGEDVSRGFSRAFNIILTPDSYSSLMTLEKDARTDSESKQQLGFKMCTSDDPDIVFLHELGDENLSFTTPKPSAGRKSDRTSNLGPQPLCNTPSRSTQDDDHYVHHFQDVVAKKLIPHDTSAQVDGTRCPGHVIVSLSQTWEPLHHAICAIKLNTMCSFIDTDYAAGQPSIMENMTFGIEFEFLCYTPRDVSPKSHLSKVLKEPVVLPCTRCTHSHTWTLPVKGTLDGFVPPFSTWTMHRDNTVKASDDEEVY
ncbi:hypothetical protein KCU67_g620, partial [Aureobasidium melanogenum]